ncbi:MAG: hypothetical protein LBE82_04930 [Chitinophagaceae bacterium]|jgi:hypothetical protein|nr:hypothetical protein [Chitinophagaceae bacterium]
MKTLSLPKKRFLTWSAAFKLPKVKTSYLLNFIFIPGTLLSLFFLNRDKDKIAELEIKAQKWERVEDMEAQFESRAATWPARANEGGTTIDSAVAHTYIRNFVASEMATKKKGDFTESVWIDATSLSSMMHTIMENNGDGIRVYFSRYSKLYCARDKKVM